MKNVNEYVYTKMPWGKYKGRYLSEISEDYLIWCSKNWEDRGMVGMVKIELERRDRLKKSIMAKVKKDQTNT